jgi:anti-sigma factor RsiW
VPFEQRVRRWALPVVSFAALAASLILFLTPQTASVSLGDEAISAHIRASLGSHLVDVAAAGGNAQSYLSSHLDFTAPVADLGKSGYQLVGARLDYLRHREVAALAYRHDAHLVSLFIFPETEKNLDSATHAERGFTCMTWKQGNLRYVEVSDLDRGAMDAMRQDLARGS